LRIGKKIACTRTRDLRRAKPAVISNQDERRNAQLDLWICNLQTSPVSALAWQVFQEGWVT
jgi:hypothetical protein